MQDQKIRKINFEIISDNSILHGTIDFLSKRNPVVIFIPGISGKALTDRFDWIAEIFTRAGYNFVRFNFRGYENNNNFEDSSLEEEMQDIKNLLKELKKMGFEMQRYGIVAKSIGALKALLIQDPNLKCLGLFSPAINLTRSDNLSKTVKIPYKNIKEYFEYKLSSNMLNNINASIIFYGGKDQIVSKQNIEDFFEHLPGSKEIFCIPNETHGLEEQKTKTFIGEKITVFFRRHLRIEKS